MAGRRPIDVEALLIWVYRDQRADRVIERGAGLMALEAAADGVELQNVSADGCAMLARQGVLGCRVDGGGMGNGDLHPDAETVHRVLRGLPASGTLIMNARQGCRPDWKPRPSPRLHRMFYPGERRAVVHYWPEDRHRNYGWCPLIVRDGPEEVALARRLYAIWHDGLARLVAALGADRLATWAVTGPDAPPRPWQEPRR